MKNKKKWKSLNRRGLAALLTLAMCLGTVPFTAFAAEDTHEHNQNGWYCEWVEPEQELNCQHEHDEDCYVPGEPVLECTEDHHEEDCYVPGEDVLTCENEDEDHEHDEDCYASGEAVLECDEDHHTEDCYAPGEPVLDCRHEHGEDCFSAAEGFWSCTPPVEDAADEADKDVVEDEGQFDNDGNQGAIVEDETFEDDDQTDVEDEGVFNDDEQQNDVEDEDEALIPDEVQAFLDAVAAIPEITPENAEEVAEYVYGEVSEYYEVLLGTEYEDREDVQEAAAVYAAAVEAVDAALDMESAELASGYTPVENVGIYPDRKPSGTTATGKVRDSGQSLTMKVGQKASFLLGAPVNTLLCGKHGYIFANYNPSDYCDISLIDNSGKDIVGNPTYAAGTNKGERVFDTQFEALKPGKSNDVRVCYYANFGIVLKNGASSGLMVCPYYGGHYVTVYEDVKWYRYNDVFGITVNADYVLNYDANGGSVDPTFEKKTAASTTCTFDLPTPIREGYTFKGWAESADAKTGITGSCTLNWAEGYGSADNPVSKTLYAVWEEDVEDTTYTVTYTDGVKGETVFDDKVYEDLTIGGHIPAFTGTLERKGYTFKGWTPEVKKTVKEAVEAGQADDNGNIVYTAQWEKKDSAPEAPKRTDLYGILHNFVEVVCVSDPADSGNSEHKTGESKEYCTWTGTLDGKYESEVGEVYQVENQVGNDWMVDVKLNGDVYAAMYGTEPDFGTGVKHTLAEDEDATKTITLKWDAATGKWKAAIDADGNAVDGVTNGTILAAFKVVCKAPEILYTVIYKDGFDGAFFGDESHGNLKVGDNTPGFLGGTLTRGGYTFDGWELKNELLTPAGAVHEEVAAADANDKNEIIYTAHWTENVKYTLTYDAKGGTPVPDKQEQENDPTFKISNVEPAKEGYIFKGWADSENATTAIYQPKGTITLTKEEPDKTIFAVWEIDEDAASIDVTKTIEMWEDGKWKPVKDDDKLVNGQDVRFTVTVKNTGKFALDNLEFFDDMNEKLTGVKNVKINKGWTAAYKTGKNPSLYIKANGILPVDDGTVKVRYEATTTGVEGIEDEKVTNKVDVYAKIAETAPANQVGRMMTLATDDEDEWGEVGKDDNLKPGESTPGSITDSDSTNIGTGTGTTPPVEPENVTITIEYVDEANKIIGTFTKEVDKGNEYNVIDDIKAPDGYAIISITGDSTSGTANSDKTITVTCGEDKRGNDNGNSTDKPDGIPDVFQPIVTYIVTGGTWQENGSTEKEVVFNLVDEQGNPVTPTPTLNGTIPTPVVNAATNTEDGAGWTGTVPAADTEVTKDGATYRYEFPALEGMRIITVNRVHNGNTIVSIPVTVPDGEAYTVTDADAPAAFDNGGNHYIRIDATLPTVPAGDEDVSVDVRYALDNIGGGTNGNSPDGIPDGQQAVVYYRSSNTAYGTVRDAYQLFDLRPDIASREETLRNAATVVGRARFTNWTMGSQALSTNATLENAFTVEAGHTYTVTANFTGYTGGGSSGGGGGGGGGGGSSSGNTNNNNTNNDTTTNDDVVTINDADVPLADLTSLNREDHFAYVSGYKDGTVRPTNNITREEVAAIFYRLLTDVSRAVYETGVNNFSDVDSSRWSNNAISTLANAGIISGYKEGTFKPGQTITRAEFAAIASRFDSVSEDVTNPFTDTEGHWAEQLISNAADKGWVGGYPDSTFRPSNAITRAEAMTLINKVLNREVDKEGLLADAKQWPDNQEGKWYYYQVLEATNSHDYERRSADSYVENWTAITQK